MKGNTFGNTIRKGTDMPVSEVEHLLTNGELRIVAMYHRIKSALYARIYLILNMFNTKGKHSINKKVAWNELF